MDDHDDPDLGKSRKRLRESELPSSGSEEGDGEETKAAKRLKPDEYANGGTVSQTPSPAIPASSVVEVSMSTPVALSVATTATCTSEGGAVAIPALATTATCTSEGGAVAIPALATMATCTSEGGTVAIPALTTTATCISEGGAVAIPALATSIPPLIVKEGEAPTPPTVVPPMSRGIVPPESEGVASPVSGDESVTFLPAGGEKMVQLASGGEGVLSTPTGIVPVESEEADMESKEVVLVPNSGSREVAPIPIAMQEGTPTAPHTEDQATTGSVAATGPAWEDKTIDEGEKLELLISAFSNSQQDQYEIFRRSTFPKSSIRKIMQGVCGGSNVPQNAVIAMAGITKVFVGEIVEEACQARERAKEEGAPLQPKHIREAVRRLKNNNKLPNSKYKKVFPAR